MTKDYYLKNAAKYINETRRANIDYSMFEKYLMPGSHVMDLGSGSGRDCFHFNFNFKVSALDYIPEFINQVRFVCEEAMVKDMKDFEEFDKYDGIWAHDSLIHLSSNEIIEVLNKCYYALHGSGVMYCSFNYGEFSGVQSQRYMNFMTEEKFQLILDNTNFTLSEQTIMYESIRGNDVKIIAFILSK
jgi:SAM-dependent methyltransferase